MICEEWKNVPEYEIIRINIYMRMKERGTL